MKWWACSEDEQAQNFEARKGDALLQNHLLSVAIRSPWVSLSRLDQPGGTLIDAGPIEGRDWVLEGIPTFQGTPTGLTLLDDGVAVEGTDVVWRLDPELPLITLESASGELWLQGDRRHEPLGPGWYRNDQRLITDGLVVEDTGGVLVLSGVTRIWVGEAPGIHALLYDLPVSGTCSGDRVKVLLEGEEVAWLEPTFEDTVPSGSLLVCSAAGFEDGEPVEAARDLELSPGEGGLTWVRASAPGDRDIPALASNADGRWPVPPGGAWIPTLDPVEVSRGPGWSSVVGTEVVLERLVPEDWLLADLFREAMPSINTRTEAGDDLQLAAAEGIGFAVQSAPDEIGRPYTTSWFERWIRAQAGSWAATDSFGALLSWPHNSNPRKAAHGAVPWQGLSPSDLLAMASGPDRRLTVVEPAWVEAAGHPAHWDPMPDLLRLDGLEELELLFTLLDAGVSLGVAGPATWLPVLPEPLPGIEECERALIEDRSVASSGPLLVLSDNEFLLPQPGLPYPITVDLFAGGGTVEVYVDGALVHSEEMTHGQSFALDILGERWALAVLRGQDWTVSAPLSLR